MVEYLIKSTLALSVAYVLYLLFMRNNIDFRWLRIYFIVTILFSLLMPIVKYIPWFHQEEFAIPEGYIPDFLYKDKLSGKSSGISFFSYTALLRYGYLAGLLFTVIQSFIGFFQLAVLVFKHGISKMADIRIVFVPNLQCPFSFFQLVFIDPEHFSDAGNGALLRHEKVHSLQWHSLDLFLLEILTAINWYNPLAWKIKRTLKELHEFQADQGAIGDDYSPVEYQHLLLRQACGLNTRIPVNGFHGSLTKKRILMITNNKRNKRWVAAFSLLLVAIFVIDSLSRVNVAQEPPKKQKDEVTKKINKEAKKDTSTWNNGVPPPPPPPPPPPTSEIAPPPPPPPPPPPSNIIGKINGEDVYVVVDENAKFQGGDVGAFIDWVQSNLKYPEEAVKNKVEGKVIVSFVVNPKGEVIGSKVLRTVSPELSEEALRVIKSSPDWTAGKMGDKPVYQSFAIPVLFKIGK
jgi:TonB family protein